MPTKPSKLRVGTSGFHYNHWKGIFYPEKLPKSKWFSFYAQHFDTVEINNTFYHLPTANAFDCWRNQAPPGFLYALKFNRYGSHWMRLKNPDATIGNFLNVAKRLEEFFGPILVQLPPNWNVDAGRLNSFLAAAPRTLRWAVEFRNPSWLCDEVYAVLEQHGAALCIHDMIKNHPRVLTADWTYLRYHGDHYSGSYSPQKLSAEAEWIRRHLATGKDVFAYFNNDAQGYAVKNAVDLRRYIAESKKRGNEAARPTRAS
jgi:uncharacterized protein YecE (DUF72 family)